MNPEKDIPFSAKGLSRILRVVLPAGAPAEAPARAPSIAEQAAAFNEAIEEARLARHLQFRKQYCPELDALLGRLALKPAA